MNTLFKGHIERRKIVALLAAMVALAGLLWFTSSGNVGTVSADEGLNNSSTGGAVTQEHEQQQSITNCFPGFSCS